MIGAFPRSVESEMALDPLGPENHSCDVGSYAEVMSGKPDPLDFAVELLLEPLDFQQADILKSNRIARGAAVDDEIFSATFGFEELDDLIFFGVGCHAEGEVDFTVVVSQR